jgi:divalent metal cation (Fe/Co/Zn/Cd) transporter
MPSEIAIYVTILSIIGKGILAAWQFKVGKRTDSTMIIANAKNMQNDVIISLSVLLGLAFTFIFKMPILDIITAFAVSGWIMYVAFKIFMESNVELISSMARGRGRREVVLGRRGWVAITAWLSSFAPYLWLSRI